VSVRSRVAFATGVAGLAGAVAVLVGRADANIGLLLLLAMAPVAGATGVAVAASQGASVVPARIVRFTPAWALVAAAGAIRAGSGSFSDVRGANAVAGIALARGPVVSVAGAWLALIAGVIALAGTVRSKGAGGGSMVLRALETGGGVALGVFLGGLFAGPQVRAVSDAIWWAAVVVVAGLISWRARDLDLPDLWVAAMLLAAAGLALTIAGGSP